MSDRAVRRGLAATAVAALAITGLGITAPPARAAADGVVLVSQAGAKVSLRRDGSATNIPPGPESVDLVAQRHDPNMTVTFQVNPDPTAADDAAGWVTIGTSPNSSASLFTALWDGTADGTSLVGTSVSLRAVGVDGDETSYSTRHQVAVTGNESATHSVDLNAVAGGYFVQPYADSARTATLVRVAGTTSASTDTVQLDWWRASDGTFAGQTDVGLDPYEIKVFDPTGSTYVPGGQFTTALDITGYDAAANDGALAVRAERDSDAVFVTGTYAQIPTTVSADLGATRKAGTDVSVHVYDQNSTIVAGAEVRRVTDGSLLGYTDASGRVDGVQPNGTSASYYVNTTDADAYAEGNDPVSPAQEAPAYVPKPTSTQLVLADGAVFDDDEYAAGDVALQLLDDEGDPLPQAGQEIRYSLHPQDAEAPEPTVGVTDEDGRVVVPFDVAGPDGTWAIDFTTPSGAGAEPLPTEEFVAGDATLRLSPAAGKAAPGGQLGYTGVLMIGDVAVPGRTIGLSYTRGQELVPGTGADAGLLVGGARRLAASAVTDADGRFTVTVDDPTEAGNPTETVGKLVATAKTAQTSASATATFGSAKGTVRLRLKATSKGAAADRLTATGSPSIAGERVQVLARTTKGWKVVKTLTLGRTGGFTLTVKDTNGKAKTSYQVRLLPSARAAASTSATVKVP